MRSVRSDTHASGCIGAADLNLAVGSSIVGGTIHIMGTALAKVISDHVPGVYATAQNTSGPQASLQMIETGEMKIGIVSTPILYDAMEGKAKWTMGRQFEQFRTIAVLYSSQFQWFAIKPELKYVHDLNGRILNVSAPGATSDQVGSLINDIIGVKLGSKIIPPPQPDAICCGTDASMRSAFPRDTPRLPSPICKSQRTAACSS